MTFRGCCVTRTTMMMKKKRSWKDQDGQAAKLRSWLGPHFGFRKLAHLLSDLFSILVFFELYIFDRNIMANLTCNSNSNVATCSYTGQFHSTIFPSFLHLLIILPFSSHVISFFLFYPFCYSLFLVICNAFCTTHTQARWRYCFPFITKILNIMYL